MATPKANTTNIYKSLPMQTLVKQFVLSDNPSLLCVSTKNSPSNKLTTTELNKLLSKEKKSHNKSITMTITQIKTRSLNPCSLKNSDLIRID